MRALMPTEYVVHRGTKVLSMVREELGIGNLVLYGGAPRDLYLNEEPRDWDIAITGIGDINQYAKVLLATLPKIYPHKPDEGNGQMVVISGYNGATSLGTFMINDLPINLVITNSGIPKVDWDVNQGIVLGTNKSGGSNRRLEAVKGILIEGVTSLMLDYNDTNPKKTLARGQQLVDKYGLTLSPTSVNKLVADMYEPEEEEIMLRGLRMFSPWYEYSGLTDKNPKVRIHGATGVVWETAELTAQCNVHDGISRGHANINNLSLQAMSRDHLKKGTCSCGIYLVKNEIPHVYEGDGEYTILAQAHMWGYVIELQNGYRAEHARLEAMWMLPKQRLKKGSTLQATLKRIQNERRELSTHYGIPVEVLTNNSLISVREGLVTIKPDIKIAPANPRWRT